MKILLVSDEHHFSAHDIFNSYVDAFKHLRIEHDVANLAELLRFYSPEMAWGLVMAKILNEDGGFTHVLFCSGMQVPDWLLKSKYTKKYGILAFDDPHASKITVGKKKYLDYYFTNEKTMADEKNKMYYLPTATHHIVPAMDKSELAPEFRNDVVFIGTVYDDRIKPLEDACRFCEKNNLSIKIIGPLLKATDNEIIKKHAINGVVANQYAKLMYRGARIVINIDRNVKWNPFETSGNSILMNEVEPYSSNPRAYEISACKATQLFINPRQEVKDLFGNSVFYCGYDNIEEGLSKIIATSKSKIKEKADACYTIINKDHTYINRTLSLIEYIRTVDQQRS